MAHTIPASLRMAIRTSTFQRTQSHPLSRFIIAVFVVGLCLWAMLPIGRGVLLIIPRSPSVVGPPPPDLAAQSVSFRTADGVSLHGWLIYRAASAPTIILVSGYRQDRRFMLPYARFLATAGFNILLYDSRSTGESGGEFGLGLREVQDVKGAVAYLQRRRDLPVHRYGLLGVSLGAGVAIVAASQLPLVRATVADSAYRDQQTTVSRLNSLHIGPVSVPLLPLAEVGVNWAIGGSLSAFSPLHAIEKISPRAILLIHSRHDGNVTTPLAGALALYRTAHRPDFLWVAPRGGHAGAYAAQPTEYIHRVVAFFKTYLKIQ